MLGWAQLYTKTVSEISLHLSVENQAKLDSGICFRKRVNDPNLLRWVFCQLGLQLLEALLWQG